MLVSDNIEKPPFGDPSDCKSCPQWNDRIGRCMVPLRERRDLCGSLAELFETPVSTSGDFELFPRRRPQETIHGT
jgi:hypothetical protein